MMLVLASLAVAVPLVIDRRLEVWTAMEVSRRSHADVLLGGF